jgi:uncharacterized protein
MSHLNQREYMRFPFALDAHGAVRSTRSEHVREQIEQVLFTLHGERWYRPEFGVGVRALVFEPNNEALAQLTKKRLLASLAQALSGEVDPKNLGVEVERAEEKLLVTITYTLAALNHSERQQFLVGVPHG